MVRDLEELDLASDRQTSPILSALSIRYFPLHSFPRSAWECRPGRSASSSERRRLAHRRRSASKTAFPRRTAGTSEILS
jgi:hypothetical protein